MRYLFVLVVRMILLGILLRAHVIDAGPVPVLQTFVAQNVYYVSGALNQADSIYNPAPFGAPNAPPAIPYALRNFYLRIQAQVGFAVPTMVTLTVVPEIELVWRRENNRGDAPGEPNANLGTGTPRASNPRGNTPTTGAPPGPGPTTRPLVTGGRR